MDLVRGRDVDDALALLRFSKQRVSGMIEKVIRSAVANASEQEVAPSRNALFVSQATVDPGPVIKRFQPKDRGKAYPIKKRTSHLVVTIDEREDGARVKPKPVVGGRPGKARR
jgi:large subunit ribosomal protein L22